MGLGSTTRALNDTPDALDNVLIGNTSVRQMIALEETHIFSPSLVNSLRGGFSRVTAISAMSLQAINPLAADLSLGSFPGRPAPQIYSARTYCFQRGRRGRLELSLSLWNSFQAYDDAFLTKGVHSIKFGFAFERMQD